MRQFASEKAEQASLFPTWCGKKLDSALSGCVAVMVFTIVSTPGSRKIRIRRCVNAPLKIHEGLEIDAVTGILEVRQLVQNDL